MCLSIRVSQEHQEVAKLTSNVAIPLVDDVLHIFAVILKPVSHQNAGDAGANGQNAELAVLGVHPRQVRRDAILSVSAWQAIRGPVAG